MCIHVHEWVFLSVYECMFLCFYVSVYISVLLCVYVCQSSCIPSCLFVVVNINLPDVNVFLYGCCFSVYFPMCVLYVSVYLLAYMLLCICEWVSVSECLRICA